MTSALTPNIRADSPVRVEDLFSLKSVTNELMYQTALPRDIPIYA